MVATSIIIAASEAEAKDAQSRAREIAWDAMLRRGLPEPEAKEILPFLAGAVAGPPQTVLDELSEGLLATGRAAYRHGHAHARDSGAGGATDATAVRCRTVIRWPLRSAGQ